MIAKWQPTTIINAARIFPNVQPRQRAIRPDERVTSSTHLPRDQQPLVYEPRVQHRYARSLGLYLKQQLAVRHPPPATRCLPLAVRYPLSIAVG